MHRKLALALVSMVAVGTAACSDEDTAPVETGPELLISVQGTPDPETGAIALAAGAEDEPYEVAISAQGGSEEEYTWSVEQGQLPLNVFLRSSGTPGTIISGTPGNNGVFRFTVQVTDSDGNTTTQSFEITVAAAPPPVRITTERNLAEGATAVPYEAVIEAVDGSGEGYTWSLVQGGGTLPPGLSFTTEGITTTISGIPTESDIYDFRLRIQDSKGDSDERRFVIIVQDSTPELEIRTRLIPDGQVTVPYTPDGLPESGPVIIESVGGKGTNRDWTVVNVENGDLPPGIELAKDPDNESLGWLQGTPTAAGTFPFTVRVEDEEGNTDTESYTVIIDRAPPPLRILTVVLPDAEQNSPYTAEIEAVNGSGTGYTWSVIEGTLPAGLTLGATSPDPEREGRPTVNRLQGTPTVAGEFEFVIEVRDSIGNTNSFLYTLRIAEEIVPINIVTTTLPDVTLGDTYEVPITAANGFGAYNWVVLEGALPAGIELQVPGTPSTVLSGVAGEVGTFTATITVFDLNNDTASRVFSLTVLDGGDPLSITTATPDPAITCQPAAVPVAATEGSNFGYTWSIDPASPDPLPPGFSIDPSGTPGTTIRGIPSVDAVGTYDVVVRVEDSSGQVATRQISLEVRAGAGGQRFAALTGNQVANGVNEVSVVDICRTVPTAPVVVSPSNSARDYRADSTRTNVQFSPDGTKVAFVGNWTNPSSAVDELYVADLSGTTIAANSAIRVSGIRNATTGALDNSPSFSDVWSFRWSPDGNWISYVADQDRSGVNEMYLVDVTNLSAIRGPFRLADNTTHPSFADIEGGSEGEYVLFSPGSTKVAWMVDTAGSSDREVWASDFSSGTPTLNRRVNEELPSTSSDVLDFRWATDDYIVYSGDTSTAFRDELWLADVRNIATANATVNRISIDTSIATIRQMFDSDFSDDNPVTVQRQRSHAWDVSPQGDRVFYIGDFRTSGQEEMFVASIANGVIGASTVVNPPLDQFADIGHGAWSPDGTKIAMSGDPFQDNLYEVGVVEVGSGTTPLAPAYVVTPPVQIGTFNGTFNCTFAGSGSAWRCFSWSPNSRYIATFGDFNVQSKNELFVYDTSAGAAGMPVTVNNPQMGNSADVEFWLWSPDGNKIAYEADEVQVSQNEYYVYDLTTGSRSRINVGTNRDVYHYYSVRNMNLFWSIDGSRLFYVSDEERDNFNEAFVRDVRPDGTFGEAVRLNGTLPSSGDVFEMHVQEPGVRLYTWESAQ